MIDKDKGPIDEALFTYDKDVINISVSDIPYDPNNTNNNYCIKVSLIDFDGDMESVWCLVSGISYDEYMSNNSNDYITCVLSNNTLAGLKWGTVFPVRLLCKRRPFFDMRLVNPNQTLYIAINK